MNIKTEKPALAAIGGLRVLATLSIFLYHSQIFKQGAFPVTFFFMMSGFLLYYTKSDLKRYNSFRSWLSYVWKKLKEFYPLHIITFVYALFVLCDLADTEIVKSGLLNVFLIHAFFEKWAFDFNGLSWYLSATIFLYIVGFFLIKLIHRFGKYYKAMTVATLLGIFACNMLVWLKVPVYVYSNPIYRILDFFLGMLMARIYAEKRDAEFCERKATRYELIILFVFVVMYILSLYIKPKYGYYSILFSFALFVFAHGKGLISKILKSNIFRKASAYCFEFYMIHEVVIRTFRLLIPEGMYGHYARIFIICGISFVITSIIVFAVKFAARKISK